MSDEAMAIPARLRAMTPARVGLGRSGVSQRTEDVLSFQRSHALARDAVHAALDVAALVKPLQTSLGAETPLLRLRSAAADRGVYLQRPDLGRALEERSAAAIAARAAGECDLAVVIADGLSALAVQCHAAPLLERLLPHFAAYRLAPLCVVEQGRVAIGDAIGAILGARLCVLLIGERPGLSSPDSLGAYITWKPRVGRTDAERICVSNIRPQGLGYDEAAVEVERMVAEAFERRSTGIATRAGQARLREGTD